jgi:lysylphosphatidylglycerol synthetase-like protein (DUF2156 family)
MTRLFYPRHFTLLACFSVLLGVISSLHNARDLSVSVAMYGTLHASALVIALRTRHAIWRKCLFIAVAAVLSVLALRVGISAGQLSGMSLANSAFYGVLALSAATGAVTYGLSIRLFGIHLTLGALAAIAVACLSATCIGGFAVRHFHFLGPWCLAVVWWHAFSGGLWYFDLGRTKGLTCASPAFPVQALSGERTCSGRTPRPKI